MNKGAFLLALILAIVVAAVAIFSSEKTTGTNIKVELTNDSSVQFKPVCPKCGHISNLYSINLSSGESHSTIHMCETCYEIYDITIDRK